MKLWPTYYVQVGFNKYEERRFSGKKKKKTRWKKKEDKRLGQLVFVKANLSGSRGDSGSGIYCWRSLPHRWKTFATFFLAIGFISVWDQHANILLFYFDQCKWDFLGFSKK